MLILEHCLIRTAEPDDAGAVRSFYLDGTPRAFLLDRRREPFVLTQDELRELFARKDKLAPRMYVVEDPEGQVRGLCTLRSAGSELGFGEFVVQFGEAADFASAMAGDVAGFLCKRAFEQKRMHKVVAHCLDTEADLRELLTRTGFQSDGVQRDVVFTQGCWRRLETLSLFRRAWLGEEAAPGVA